jgi:thymidylate kinase
VEKSIKKSSIIEFNGLPASGKSSVAIKLAEQLENDGYSVCSYSEFKKAQSNNGKLDYQFDKHFLKYIKELFLFTLQQKGQPQKWENFLYSCKDFGFFLWVNKQGNYDYILMDQGIIQNMVSIVYDKEMVSQSKVVPIIQIINQLADKYIVINTIIDMGESYSRIRNRKNGHSRIEKMNRDDFMRIAAVQKRNFSFIRDQIADRARVLDIYTENIVADNVNKIVGSLGEDKL